MTKTKQKRVIAVNDPEYRLMVNGLNTFRNTLIRENKPTEDVNELILKVIDAPTRKEKRRMSREGR